MPCSRQHSLPSGELSYQHQITQLWSKGEQSNAKSGENVYDEAFENMPTFRSEGIKAVEDDELDVFL